MVNAADHVAAVFTDRTRDPMPADTRSKESVVAKPTKHGDKWRIRWVDERGKRQSAVFDDDYKRAQTELSRRQVEVEEIRRGVRNAAPPEKTFGDLCDYWIENRAPRKRSQKDDESIIRRHLRPAFGVMRVRDVGVEDVDGYTEASKLLTMKLGTLYALIAQNRVPHVRLRRRLVRFSRVALAAWVRQHTVEPAA